MDLSVPLSEQLSEDRHTRSSLEQNSGTACAAQLYPACRTAFLQHHATGSGQAKSSARMRGKSGV